MALLLDDRGAVRVRSGSAEGRWRCSSRNFRTYWEKNRKEVDPGSVGMEAQGIAVAFLPTRGDRACRSLPTFESALARRNRLLQHRIDVVVGPEQERIEHAHLQAAICGHFLQTS